MISFKWHTKPILIFFINNYSGIALEKDLIALKKELLLETHFEKGVTHFQKGIHCFVVVKSQRPVIRFTID